MSILPWSKRNIDEKTSSTVVQIKNETVAERKPEPKTDIVIHQGSPLAQRSAGSVIQVRPREVMIAGEKVKVNPYELIRCIKRVTQNIGEYKEMDGIYSKVVIGALRKARGDLVSILENEFHVHWQIDKTTGESIFFMG